MNIEYTKASESDLLGILEIMNHEIIYGTAVYDYDPKPDSFITEWFKKKRLNEDPIFVAKAKGNVIAYATYNIYIPKVGYRFCVEHSIYVKDDYQGYGIGKKLMNRLIEQAQTKGIHTMIAVIDASNSASLSFHEKFGFDHVGYLKEAGYKFDQWLDVVIMQLML